MPIRSGEFFLGQRVAVAATREQWHLASADERTLADLNPSAADKLRRRLVIASQHDGADWVNDVQQVDEG